MTISQIEVRLSSNVFIASKILHNSSLDEWCFKIENKRDNGQTKSTTEVTCLSKWLIEFRILISFSFNFNNRFLTN